MFEHLQPKKAWKNNIIILLLLIGSVFVYQVFQSYQTSPVEAHQESSAIPITIDLDGYVISASSSRPTIAQALAELGIQYAADALVRPDPSLELGVGQQVQIRNPHSHILRVDGEEIEIRTLARSLRQILHENDIVLGDLDRITPALDQPLSDGREITITRVSEQEETRTEPIAFRTEYRDDDSMSYTEESTLQAGQEGKKEAVYRLRYEDGSLIAEELISESILSEPTTEIILRGTKIVTGRNQTGHASWYNSPFGSFSAASTTFTRGSKLRVTSQETGVAVIITVHDYGPADQRRVIDLSSDAFLALGIPLWQGTTEVLIEELL